MVEKIDFTVNGIQMSLTRQAVIAALDHTEPETIRAHAVVVRGTKYPIKQAFAEATGLDRLDFTSATARRHLNRLGFELRRNG